MKLGNSLIKCNVERIGGGRKQKNIAHGRRRSSESSAESLCLRGIKKWKAVSIESMFAVTPAEEAKQTF